MSTHVTPEGVVTQVDASWGVRSQLEPVVSVVLRIRKGDTLDGLSGAGRESADTCNRASQRD